MGTIYYLIDDANREMFELGKGWGDRFEEFVLAGVPRSCSDVRAAIDVPWVTARPDWADRVAARIHLFLQHANWRVRFEGDGGDEILDARDAGYRVTGTAYENDDGAIERRRMRAASRTGEWDPRGDYEEEEHGS